MLTAKQIISQWCDNSIRERRQNKVFPNVFLGAFEADILEVTRAGYSYEYEVKISCADFKNDAKKKDRFKEDNVNSKYDILRQGTRVNYFSYVVPEGLIKSEDVPDFAGLIYCRPYIFKGFNMERGKFEEKRIRFDTIKYPEKLTKEKIQQKVLFKCLESTYYRFHKLRIREK